MRIQTITSHILSGKFIYNKRLALICWFGLTLASVLQFLIAHKLNNNYIIYRHVFYHTLHQTNLYVEYPQEYYDVFLYGPIFSLIIAPFALLPTQIGAITWVIANTVFLLFAIYQLPIKKDWRAALTLLCAHELMTNNVWLQTNAFICACLLLGFAYIQKEKEYAALFFIGVATFMKVYGIVGLAFFFFSKKPLRFILWATIWSIVLFLAPLIITSFSFLVQSYKDWVFALQAKSAKNISTSLFTFYQDISVMGMIRRIFLLPQFKDAIVLIPAIALFLSQYLHFRYFSDLRLRLYFLASVLIFTVIFSNGAEAPTYIIALPGMILWYLLQPKSSKTTIFFIVIFVLTTFSYSDLLGSWVRTHLFRPYALKALPPFILWIVILIQIHQKQFLKALLPLENSDDKLSIA